MNNPKVTVITPTFNRADLLRETISSILNQTFADFEYIIVDDGSNDHTAETLESFPDPRISIIRQANQGEAAAINAGWRVAKGEYVAIVSSDDPMLPFWLAEVHSQLEKNPQAIVAYPDWLIIDGEGNSTTIIRTPVYDRFDMAATFASPVGPGGMIRKAAGDRMAEPRPVNLRFCGDLSAWLSLALLGDFIRVPKVLACHRVHAGSISSAERTHSRADEIVALAYEFFFRSDLPPELVAIRHRGLSSAHRAAAWILEETDPIESANHTRRAEHIAP